MDAGADACRVDVTSNGACLLKADPGAELVDRSMQKAELVAKIWAKKALSKLVVSRLGDLRAKALKLMG